MFFGTVFSLTAVAQQTVKLNIPVTAPWTDIGIDILPGQRLQISTHDPSQRVQFGLGGTFDIRTCNADGIGDEGVGTGLDGTQPIGPEGTLPGTILASLIGKIGGTTAIGTGTPVPEGKPGKGAGFVGTSYNQVVPVGGRLFLGFNDAANTFFDNAGSFSETITVQSGLPDIKVIDATTSDFTSISLKYSVADSDSPAFIFRAYISSDEMFDPSDLPTRSTRCPRYC